MTLLVNEKDSKQAVRLLRGTSETAQLSLLPLPFRKGEPVAFTMLLVKANPHIIGLVVSFARIRRCPGDSGKAVTWLIVTLLSTLAVHPLPYSKNPPPPLYLVALMSSMTTS